MFFINTEWSSARLSLHAQVVYPLKNVLLFLNLRRIRFTLGISEALQVVDTFATSALTGWVEKCIRYSGPETGPATAPGAILTGGLDQTDAQWTGACEWLESVTDPTESLEQMPTAPNVSSSFSGLNSPSGYVTALSLLRLLPHLRAFFRFSYFLLQLNENEFAQSESSASNPGLRVRKPLDPSSTMINLPISDRKATRKPTSTTSVMTRRLWLLIFAITVHNIPEGFAVGIAFGGVGRFRKYTFTEARYSLRSTFFSDL
ncbi:unnamed protein product [Echinostoma caproni]|uniref:Zinc transporter ZIP11 n=1 Tax=Echinostoma caproni TaxID=27848 RepID=A0A183AB68_9TREM|nr:unnamed protein product [Echinostoma caproni]